MWQRSDKKKALLSKAPYLRESKIEQKNNIGQQKEIFQTFDNHNQVNQQTAIKIKPRHQYSRSYAQWDFDNLKINFQMNLNNVQMDADQFLAQMKSCDYTNSKQNAQLKNRNSNIEKVMNQEKPAFISQEEKQARRNKQIQSKIIKQDIFDISEENNEEQKGEQQINVISSNQAEQNKNLKEAGSFEEIILNDAISKKS